MKRALQFGWLAIVALYFLPFCPDASGQTTWYVRSDGGTATQCTGQTYAAYPGSGSAQPCAYNSPMWLVTAYPPGSSSGSVRFAGGDRVLIRAGDAFEIGIDETTGAHTGCPDAPDCHFPSFPAGTSGAHTIFAGTQDGSTVCTSGARPKLTGDDGANFIEEIFEVNPLDQNSAATNYIEYDCLELQGWTNSANNLSGASFAFKNRRGYNDSMHPPAANITLNYVSVHGFGNTGIIGGFTGVTSTNLDVERNRLSGWSMDIGDGIVWNYGSWTMTKTIIRFNGCQETASFVPTVCLDDTNGGYGDGFATPGTSGTDSTVSIDWEQPIVENNTQDGIDMLHCASGCVVTVNRGLFDGNAGNQLKGSGSTLTYTNNIIIGNCAIWASGAANYQYEKNGGLPNFDACRAFGDVVLAMSYDGGTVKIQQNSFTGQGNYALDEGCRLTCATPTYTIQNNIFYGDASFTAPGNQLNSIYGTVGTQNEDHNDWYQMKNPLSGTGDITSNPLIVNYSDSNALDAHETVNSSTRGAGTNDGVTLDYAGVPRPQGKGWDIGAYQFGGSGAPPTKPNPPSNLKVVVQ